MSSYVWLFSVFFIKALDFRKIYIYINVTYFEGKWCNGSLLDSHTVEIRIVQRLQGKKRKRKSHSVYFHFNNHASKFRSLSSKSKLESFVAISEHLRKALIPVYRYLCTVVQNKNETPLFISIVIIPNFFHFRQKVS